MKPIAFLAALLVVACGPSGSFIEVDDYAQQVNAAKDPQANYVIGPGDVISIRVYNQEGMSAHGRVRPDGKLSIPFLNDVEVAGYTPTALAQQLQTRLKEFIHLPVVTVALDEPRTATFSLIGEVGKTGQYPIDPQGTTVLQALAMGGGITDFAHKDRIFVIRQGPPLVRIRFKYDQLRLLDQKASQFRLQAGDVIDVE